MGTQFMPSAYHGNQASQSQLNGYPSNKNGGFSFRKRVERVDWRKIASVDVENISRTLDFTTLQDNIMNLTFCNLEAELDIRSVDPNFVKLFKLAQLTIEYLLHSQEYLAGLCASLEEKSKQNDQESEKMKQELEEVRKELAEVKKESHKRKKMLIAQQQLMYAGNESYNKCPFCAKAFLNNSYLQSHITRRHAAGGIKDNASTVSPDLGVGSESSHNNLEAEVSQIKERLLRQEAELQEERRALMSLKNKSPRFADNKENSSENKENENSSGMSAVIMKEMKELNAKYQSSQKALKELESRSGGKRSYLGDLEDDVEHDKDQLKEQRSEVAQLKEQLQGQLNQMEDHMSHKLTRQEKKWQKKVMQMTQHHASEIRKLNNVLESTSRSMEGTQAQRQMQQEVQEVLRHSREQEKALGAQEQNMEEEISRVSEVKITQSPSRRRGSHTPRGTTPRSQRTPRDTREAIKHSSMYPSDDEDDVSAFGTGTSSLRTLERTPGRSTLGMTGQTTASLHASQFLEELRKNPTLAVMREELASLLQEHVEKKGISQKESNQGNESLSHENRNKNKSLPAGKMKLEKNKNRGKTKTKSRCSKCKVKLSNSCEDLKFCRKHMKYLNFHALRDHFNKLATEKARKQMRQQQASPRGPPHGGGTRRRLDMTPRTPRGGSSPSRPPHPQQHLTPSRHNPQAHSPIRQSPQPQPRAKTPMSTGSTTEWTSTQWDSEDEDDSDDEEESMAGRGGVRPSPGARLVQSSPARGAPSPSPRTQGPKPRLIQSRPMNNDEDIDDILESEGEDRYGSGRQMSPKRSQGGSISTLRSTIESKLGSRNPGSKPAGGVDLAGNHGRGPQVRGNMGANLDDESDWDDTTANEPAPQRRPVRVSTEGMSTNTYGTSAWGSSGKAASTVKDKERRSTSRSSFASITSVSSDDDMNVDNI